MALKNTPMHEFALERLDVQPDERVLEIGFGPGVQLARIAEQASAGLVAGIDLSDVMVAQARARLRHVPGGEGVELRKGSVAALPWAEGHFTKVCATNNFQFWPDQEKCLAEARRVLQQGGTLLLCLRTKEVDKSAQLAPGFTDQELDEVVQLLQWVGFESVRMERRQLGPRGAVCVLGER